MLSILRSSLHQLLLFTRLHRRRTDFPKLIRDNLSSSKSRPTNYILLIFHVPTVYLAFKYFTKSCSGLISSHGLYSYYVSKSRLYSQVWQSRISSKYRSSILYGIQVLGDRRSHPRRVTMATPSTKKIINRTKIGRRKRRETSTLPWNARNVYIHTASPSSCQ